MEGENKILELDEHRKKKGLPTSEDIADQKKADRLAEELMKSIENINSRKKSSENIEKEAEKDEE